MKVVDNLQVFIDRVHVRYEDDGVSVPGVSFALGVTLDHIHAQSTDADWTPSFLTVAQKLAHKLVSLKHLAVYFNTNDKPLQYASIDDFQLQMRRLVRLSSSTSSSSSY